MQTVFLHFTALHWFASQCTALVCLTVHCSGMPHSALLCTGMPHSALLMLGFHCGCGWSGTGLVTCSQGGCGVRGSPCTGRAPVQGCTAGRCSAGRPGQQQQSDITEFKEGCLWTVLLLLSPRHSSSSRTSSPPPRSS